MGTPPGPKVGTSTVGEGGVLGGDGGAAHTHTLYAPPPKHILALH